MSKSRQTIPGLIEACGGPHRIAEASRKTHDPIGHWAVRKWPMNGIPRTHFELVRKLSGRTIDDIHNANMSVEVRRRPLKRRKTGEVRLAGAA